MRSIDVIEIVVYTGIIMFGFVLGEYFFGAGMYGAIGSTIGIFIGVLLR